MKTVGIKPIKKNILDVDDLDKLENEIPERARIATRNAYENTLRGGRSVVREVNGVIYKVSPDGKRESIKQVEKNRIVAANSRFKILKIKDFK